VRDENPLSFIDLTCHSENLSQPESAKDERPFLSANSVVRSIAIEVRALPQLGSDPLDGPKHTVIAGRQETVNGKHEQ